MPNAKRHCNTPHNPDHCLILDTDDFERQTAFWPANSIALHLRLMIWSRKFGPLPADVNGARAFGLTGPAWRQVRKLWTRRAAGWICAVVEASRAARAASVARATTAGEKSAAARAARRAPLLPLESRTVDSGVLRHARASPANLKVLIRMAHDVFDRPCPCPDCVGLSRVDTSPYLELQHRAGLARLSWHHDPDLIRKAIDVATETRRFQS